MKKNSRKSQLCNSSNNLPNIDYQKVQEAIYEAILDAHKKIKESSEQSTDETHREDAECNVSHSRRTISERIYLQINRFGKWCAHQLKSSNLTGVVNILMIVVITIVVVALCRVVIPHATNAFAIALLYGFITVIAIFLIIATVGMLFTDDETTTIYFNKITQSLSVIIASAALIVAIVK